MSSSFPVVSRALLRSLKPTNKRPICASCSHTGLRTPSNSRNLSAVASHHAPPNAPSDLQETTETGDNVPRWSRTPPQLKSPYRIRPKAPDYKPFKVNGDPRVLDEMYTGFIGVDGPQMLSEETKWLAVTHKSFDHGRRGFNDRLAFLGKRIVELQASLEMLATADASGHAMVQEEPDEHGRQPFQHPALASVEVLGDGSTREKMLHPRRMAKVAAEYGIDRVVRWQPKSVESLQASGSDMVYAQAVYAIIGALSLEQGAVVANSVARDRVLKVLGQQSQMVGDESSGSRAQLA